MRVLKAGVAGLMLAGAAAAAQDAPPPVSQPCALPLRAPPPFVGWDRPLSLVATDRADPRAAPTLPAGRAAVVTLAPAATAAFAVEPARRGGPAAYGGTVMLTVARAGTYRVGLGAPAWVDVVANGAALPALAHGHGAACSAVVKQVDYRLARGRYRLQLSAAAGPVLPAMVAPVG